MLPCVAEGTDAARRGGRDRRRDPCPSRLRPWSAWRSKPPRRCFIARETTCKKCRWRMFPDHSRRCVGPLRRRRPSLRSPPVSRPADGWRGTTWRRGHRCPAGRFRASALVSGCGKGGGVLDISFCSRGRDRWWRWSGVSKWRWRESLLS
jgi:hypothetical protein